jgi:hypothetical protein
VGSRTRARRDDYPAGNRSSGERKKIGFPFSPTLPRQVSS